MSLKDFKERRKESAAFKKIVAKQTLQVRRKAFADEALVQAKKKGKELAIAKANKPSFGKKLAMIGTNASANLAKKVLTPPKRAAPTRTVVRRAVVKRKVTRRPIARKRYVAKRTVIRRPIQKIVREKSAQEAHFDPFSQSISTGY